MECEGLAPAFEWPHTWPWYAYVGKHAEVLPSIRRLAHDQDERVRASTCEALIGARDLASFYPLWFMSVFDRSESVRRAVHLDLLLEHNPLGCAALLIWPTLIAAAASWLIARGLPPKSRVLSILAGMLVGYALGVGGGVLIGTYRASNPFVHALFLAPAMTVPITVLLVAVIASLRFSRLTGPVPGYSGDLRRLSPSVSRKCSPTEPRARPICGLAAAEAAAGAVPGLDFRAILR
jgi:hypothetical protein